MEEKKARCYLELVQEKEKSPNFLMSEEYIDLAELEWVEKLNEKGQKISGFVDDTGGWYFPYYNKSTRRFKSTGALIGFQGEKLKAVWDEEFIYNPNRFCDLSGNKWKVFRRNVRKHSEADWEYRRLAEEDNDQVENMFLNWSAGRELYDPETFVSFVFGGQNRFGLFLKGELRGVNIADENFMYINFRFCFDSGEKFLNEFLRWKFYTSEWVLNKNKLVNDGGSLGNEGLAGFKKKLRPVDIIKVCTGIKE